LSAAAYFNLDENQIILLLFFRVSEFCDFCCQKFSRIFFFRKDAKSLRQMTPTLKNKTKIIEMNENKVHKRKEKTNQSQNKTKDTNTKNNRKIEE
jgi:hypothetical protein